MTVTQAAPAPRVAPPLSGWDTRLFVLRGDSREDLRERVLELATSVERNPAGDLADLAATLAAELQPGGSRLAVVAGSAADLMTKLRRAADRLADPKCRQIRDAAGAYFSDTPLFTQGTLALLFPGEGAQYPDMLADLCGVFPEVEQTFAWSDRIAAAAGQTSLRSMLHLPPDASPVARAAAEAELRQLGPSIFGVLIADQAIYAVLQNLRVPTAAMAGHSAGELAALLAAGAMRSQEVHGPKLPEIMDLMQRQEEAAGGPDVALLAVGAGKAAVVEVADRVAGGGVIVAMDNCPHQCVAVGPTPLIAAVESALTERGVICERLPFRRPYHTPLFEPLMGAFRELFADVPFETPHTPVYSCSTGELFPNDPAAVHELAVNHWVRPVEFTRMIERMYADGVRLFVEAGPRGNLSAFVEDILRGKPFVAIPANVPRKSGPTQMNHLVGLLAAHHVPVNLGHLFGATEPRVDVPQPHPIRAIAATGSPPPEVMTGYLAVMEQFLDVQREVMTAFLAGSEHPSPVDSLIPDTSPIPQEESAPSSPEASFALVGSIEQHDPGRSIVFRRVMDLREDLYADDHTLGGRGVSRVDPRQNGLPVLPMTFSLEAMAEAASLLAPGKVVTTLRDIRLFRWLPFDPEPTTLEVRASITSIDPDTGVVEVTANVRDLGNSFLRDGANKPACQAKLVLADRYPEPPELRPFRLSNEQPCRSSVEDLRRNMFHGPLFQMLHTLGRYGSEGIEGALEVQPRDRWLTSNPDPRIVLDPVLTDAAMHILGAWHLEQPDWSGRILLPIGMQLMEYFGPPPPPGTQLFARGHNEEETPRQVRHGLEVYDADGRLWLRLTGAGYWRFYLPFVHVNFFGPKDEYFLSRGCPEAVEESAERGTRNAGVKAEAGETGLTAARATFGRCHFLEPPVDLMQPVIRAAGAGVTMTPQEQAEFRAWTGTDAGLNDWFFGRLIAKDAVRAAWNAKHGGSMFPADMETEVRDGRFTIRPRGGPLAEPFPPVSVAIADGKVAAFAAFTDRVGVGLVMLPKKVTAEAERTARHRAACLAVADALRLPAEQLSIAAEHGERLLVAAGRDRIRVQTARQRDAVIATTVCETDPG